MDRARHYGLGSNLPGGTWVRRLHMSTTLKFMTTLRLGVQGLFQFFSAAHLIIYNWKY